MFLNSFLFSAGLLIAHTDTLQTVIVTADKGVVVSRTDTTMISPTQTVVDVLNNYSSLLLSDYGGLAGNKSVSFRGLGSAHTNIYVDGVKVGNVQSGQTDLGSLSFNTYSKLAVDYAQNSVYLTTSMPSSQKKVSGEVAFRGGTWNTYLPYARLNVRLSENVVSSYTAGGIFSKGNYSYGEAGIVRENNDMKQGQFGADFWGTLQNGTWHTKAYLNTSDRGVAGSTSWPSADRQNDKNMFLQGSLSNRFNSLYEFTSSAKLSYDYMRYESSYGENYYKQFEGQINTSHLFHFTKWFTLSASLDAFIDNLCSDNYNAFRTNLNTVITAAFRTQRLKANVSVDYLGTFDKDGENRNALMPAIDLRMKVFNGFDLVAFGRRTYRVPTFNELYYVGFGNPDLKCEDAWLSDFGVEWNKCLDAWSFQAKADYFYNYLTDKITSALSPDDTNVWAPYNIGKVQINGFDLSVKTKYQIQSWKMNLGVRYTLQNALDKTIDSYTFDEQIPYVAKHAFSINLDASYKDWNISGVFNHRSGRKDSMGSMPAWNTLDITASKTFVSKYMIFVKTTNLTNTKYEISTGYPMPGISVQGGFNLRF